MAEFFPEAIHAVKAGQKGDEYIFSDGQQPPGYARVWYENNPNEIPPGFVVSLRAEGSFTQNQLALLLGGDDVSFDPDAVEIIADHTVVRYAVDLRTDPRSHDPNVADAVAREAARHLFSIATLQKQEGQ